MQRLYFFLPIFLLASLLAGCTGSASAQSKEVQTMNEAPTKLPEKPSQKDAATPEAIHHDPPASCPVTAPQSPPFAAPEPYSPTAPITDWFWYGSNSLWTEIPQDGTWYGLPHNPDGYTQKIFWWREGYIWNEEPEPALIVTGERLDADAPPLIVSKATNAYADDIGSAMLVGVDFPTLGCWKITGKYAEAELGFVVWVAP